MGNPPSMDNRFFRRAMAPSGSPRLEAEPRPSAGNVTAHQPPTFVGRNRKSRSREAACEGDGYGDLCPSCTANSPWRAKGYFGEFFRRMRAKLGTAQAITATTHKIARTLYHILLTKKPCAETVSSTVAIHRHNEEPKYASVNKQLVSVSNSFAPHYNTRITISSSEADSTAPMPPWKPTNRD